MIGRLSRVALVFSVMAVIGPNPSAQSTPSLADVLDRLGTYLDNYSDQLSRTVANEHYKQGSRSGSAYVEATLDSEFGIVKVPNYEGWIGFRDVLRVNGKIVQDHETRLQELLLSPAPVAMEQARRITEENSRYNIGLIRRNINSPAIVLELFDRRNHPRLHFAQSDEDTVDDVHVWVIKYEEVQRPTLIQTPQGADIATDGQLWVDPVTGALVRGEVNMKNFFRAGGFGASKAQMRVYFREDARMKFWVPVRLTEFYQVSALGEITGDASYSNYRQFGTETQEQFNDIR